VADHIHRDPLLTVQEADHIAEDLPDQFPGAVLLVHLPVHLPVHHPPGVHRQVLHPAAAEEDSLK